MENSVLGNALEGVPEESEEEEQPNNANVESADNLDEETREELRKQVYDAMAEEEKKEAADVTLESKSTMRSAEVKNENVKMMSPVEQCASASEEASSSPLNVEECTKDVERKSSCPEAEAECPSPQPEGKTSRGEQEGAEEPEEGKDETKRETDEDESEGNDDDDDDDEEEEEGEKNAQDNEDDVGNLQLAWEMLEVAKVIFTRKESKDEQLMAAQAYLKLGEVGAESGNYPQALDDFQECLSLQLKHLPPHSRLLAETHYHVATTLCYMDQYNQAIQHYNSSVKVIETRLAMLQEIIDAAKDAAAAEEKNEMEELKLLLPEIREKVEDAKESQRTASAASQAIQQTLGTASTSSAFLCENGGPSSSSAAAAAFTTTSQIPVKSCGSTSSSKASDISHLVRKKRKPEEGSPVKDTGAKQPKREATVNGSGESSAGNRNEIQEGKSQPATQSASESST